MTVEGPDKPYKVKGGCGWTITGEMMEQLPDGTEVPKIRSAVCVPLHECAKRRLRKLGYTPKITDICPAGE